MIPGKSSGLPSAFAVGLFFVLGICPMSIAQGPSPRSANSNSSRGARYSVCLSASTHNQRTQVLGPREQGTVLHGCRVEWSWLRRHSLQSAGAEDGNWTPSSKSLGVPLRGSLLTLSERPRDFIR